MTRSEVMTMTPRRTTIHRVLWVAAILIGLFGFRAGAHAQSANFGYDTGKNWLLGNNWYFDAGYRGNIYATSGRNSSYATNTLNASAESWGYIFGNEFRAVDVYGQANTYWSPSGPAYSSSSVNYQVYLFGAKVKDCGSQCYNNGGYFSHEFTLWSDSKDVGPQYSQTFFVGPVPVSVKIGAAATLYVKLKGTVWQNRIDATLRPGVSFGAKAYAAIGTKYCWSIDWFPDPCVGAQVGVEGSLSLIDFSLPATISLSQTTLAGVPIVNGQCTGQLNIGASAGLQLQSLSGYYGLFAQACLGVCTPRWTYSFGSFGPSYSNYWPIWSGATGWASGQSAAYCISWGLTTPPTRS
jgi:hypothetical protein